MSEWTDRRAAFEADPPPCSNACGRVADYGTGGMCHACRSRIARTEGSVKERILRESWEASEWRQKAACKGMDVAIFFEESGPMAQEARLVCARCPVREPCGEFGMTQQQGRWGGLLVDSLRKRRRMSA